MTVLIMLTSTVTVSDAVATLQKAAAGEPSACLGWGDTAAEPQQEGP